MVPVVIFLQPGSFPAELRLGGDAHCYLHFHYVACPLFALPAREYLNSPNLVARLNLPNMAYASDEKIEVSAQAVRGLVWSGSSPIPSDGSNIWISSTSTRRSTTMSDGFTKNPTQKRLNS